MNNLDKPLRFQDSIIRCRKCRKYIAKTAFDSQVLILENGLITFNCLFWQCECGRNGRFISPILPDVKPTIENLNPDITELQKQANVIQIRVIKNLSSS